MQTTRFSFELPNDEKDIANLLVQKAKEIKTKFAYKSNQKTDRLERLNKIISLVDDDISNEEIDKIRAKRYEK